jgi:2-methylcitrate dehydratase PrpD
VAAARLFKLDAAQITDALGIAASMSSGVIEANRTGGTVKRLHCGWAAHAGVSAAGLARAGFTGPPTVLEGRFGFFQAWLRGQFDAAAVTDGLGTSWAVPGIFFKPYPANHFTHSAIDAAAQLREQGLKPEDVAEVTLGVATPILRTVGEPLAVKRNPQTGYMAQFSGPYAVTVGLLGGSGLGAGLADYTDELAQDPHRRELMAKVDVVADARCDEIFPYQFPSILTVRTTDGRQLRAEVLTNRGGPERPLSFDEIAAKFTDNASRVLDSARCEDVRRLVRGFAELDDVGALLSPLTDLQLSHRTEG